MAEPIGLEVVKKRIGALMRDYDTALLKSDIAAPTLLEEIAQLNVVRSELKKIGTQVNLGRGSWPLPTPGDFPTIESFFRRMDSLTRQIAAMPREDPARHNIVNELTGLTMIADSIDETGG